MEIKNINGDILDSKTRLICHQVNCWGKMGSGVALGIAKKWPHVKEKYVKYCGPYIGRHETKKLLGMVQPVKISDEPRQEVMSLFAENNYGYDGKRYTS